LRFELLGCGALFAAISCRSSPAGMIRGDSVCVATPHIHSMGVGDCSLSAAVQTVPFSSPVLWRAFATTLSDVACARDSLLMRGCSPSSRSSLRGVGLSRGGMAPLP
jgi:hypothetical protein